VCVGPFAFDSRPSADLIELTKSEFYYDKDQVKLDAVTFVTITQPNVRSTNLLSGDVDVANDVSPSDVAKLESDPNVDLMQVISLGYQLITINVANSDGAGKPPYKLLDTPMANPDIRKAFELSLDRQTINDVVYGGLKVPGCSPLSPASPWFSDVGCTTQNIDEAKKLVAASGFATPIPVTLTVKASDNDQSKLGTVIQAMAEEAGFAVTLNPSESTTGGNAAIEGDFDTYINSWSGRIDPAQNIDQFWSPTSGLNYSGADDEEVNKLLAEAAVTSDFDTRKSVYATAIKKMNENRNYLVLFHDLLLLGTGKQVSGVEYYGDGVVRLKTASLTR
jgi:peptide/nickel transport system substrate-binding protein